MGRRQRLAAPAIVVVVAVVVAACSGGDRRLPPPSSTSSTVESTTTTRDFSQVVLPGVGGTTTTTLAETGDSSIRGSVVVEGVIEGAGEGGAGVGPGEAPLGGATVRVERLVLGTIQVREVITAEDGSYEVLDIPGGSYRVRAFLPPDVAQTEPVAFRLLAGEARDVDLRARRFEGRAIKSATSPEVPVLEGGVNVVVRLVEPVVDEEGIVRETPLPGLTVTLATSRWPLLASSEASATTDQAGEVLFELRCTSVGDPGITVSVDGGEPEPVDVADCQPPPTTTTSTSEPADAEPPDDEPPDDE